MENVTDLSDQRIRNILSKIERNRKCSKKVLLSCFKTSFEELFGMLQSSGSVSVETKQSF